MDRPGQLGYMVLNEDGAVLSSSGDLENEEKFANSIMELINLSSLIDNGSGYPEGFTKLSIVYDDHYYVICLSNRKLYIVKKSFS
ncbi:late endosomal/lysosomal adaptor, MAPK and MTOR activator 4 [Leptinotarsa decemlineata]|uniref:late endosomal/lysosomal adaptor, MAPK and MTOR activator 4 n=1 Tax=Leptinotarsa decemlineata TaxID=7539 RepID=UPI000C253C8D|nr:ragulator complex protein LAMTOR4 homolog [Leptinotarsa decemlineata]